MTPIAVHHLGHCGCRAERKIAHRQELIEPIAESCQSSVRSLAEIIVEQVDPNDPVVVARCCGSDERSRVMALADEQCISGVVGGVDSSDVGELQITPEALQLP